jgi:hypothetical protein
MCDSPKMDVDFLFAVAGRKNHFGRVIAEDCFDLVVSHF